jgi:hypothetical protein
MLFPASRNRRIHLCFSLASEIPEIWPELSLGSFGPDHIPWYPDYEQESESSSHDKSQLERREQEESISRTQTVHADNFDSLTA